MHFRAPDDKISRISERITEEFREGKKVLIWGDEDMDGITSTLIMKWGFEDIFGREVDYYIPDRKNEGYGLSKKGIDYALNNSVDLIITVDCGITSTEQVRYCNREGISVIITDHHEPLEELPDTAFLNPKLDDFGYSKLSGAGVTFKLILQIYEEYSGKSVFEVLQNFPELSVMAMLGTLGDRVAQLDENRIIIQEGKSFLKEVSLPSLVFLSKKEIISDSLTPLHSGVQSGRTMKFFNAESEKEAEEIYEELLLRHENWNSEARKKYESLKPAVSEGNLIFYSDELSPEFAGTVANRIKDKTGYPVFVVYRVNGEIRGEGRGPSDFNLLSVLKETEDLLYDYGGHKPACGFYLKEGKVEEFKERAEPLLRSYRRETRYDSELRMDEVNDELKELIIGMHPFGRGNPVPVFLIKDVDYEFMDDRPFIIKDGKEVELDGIREMPPPSKRVNAFIEIDGYEVILKKWDWI